MTREEKITLVQKRVKSSDDRSSSSLMGYIDIQYQEIVDILGESNLESDGYKVDAEWGLTFDDVTLCIYNYKDGINYCGEIEGTPIEFITDWHVGGTDKEKAAEFIKFIIENRTGPYPEKEITQEEKNEIIVYND